LHLFTDTDGFSNGGSGVDAGGVLPEASTDAPLDAIGSTDASFDAPPDAPSFRDDFSREDNPAIGNGWVEKTPDAFALVAGAVTKNDTGTHYRNNLVTRPTAEDRADVEVSAIFTLGASEAFPQVFARAQRTTLGATLAYDAYIFFLSTGQRGALARQHGDIEEVVLTAFDLPVQLAAGVRLRLTLRVYGESPPVLEGLVDRIEGASTTRIVETKITDGAPERIDTSGATGFTASYKALTAVDDFEWRALGTR
jgi:hypothetical protein